MPSHFGFDTAIRLHATSEIPNKRTKLSSNMKRHYAIMYCQVKKTHKKISKQIKLKWKYNKNAFNKECTILKVRKRKINMNVVKDVQKLKVHSQLESKLSYANNAFNMELDILTVRKMSRKKCMKRRNLVRGHIQNTHVSSKNNKIMENNGDDIDFLVEFPVRMEILFMLLPWQIKTK